MSSRPKNGIDDWEIYSRIQNIVFSFGGEIHTVSEAQMLFAYEIHIAPKGSYIIALTEKYGTLAFDLPEDLVSDLRKKFYRDESIRAYLSGMIEERAAARELIHSAYAFGSDTKTISDALMIMSKMAGQAADPKGKSNNWLKMHGRPMRRKGRGKRKNE